MTFQSTRPVWGATLHSDPLKPTRKISIHAPRVGRDVAPAVAVEAPEKISIHAPRVGRDRITPRILFCAPPISIHAPRVGRDHMGYDEIGHEPISIHAPRVGRDISKLEGKNGDVHYFNPRAPCGARLTPMVS